MNEVLIGTWIATSDVIKSLELKPDGMCHVDGTPARWQVEHDEIWLLDTKARGGTKWKFAFDGDDAMIFSSPDDFKYIGGSSYIYFQLIDPGTVIRLERKK